MLNNKIKKFEHAFRLCAHSINHFVCFVECEHCRLATSFQARISKQFAPKLLVVRSNLLVNDNDNILSWVSPSMARCLCKIFNSNQVLIVCFYGTLLSYFKASGNDKLASTTNERWKTHLAISKPL